MFDDLTPERIREIEARWKSDVDAKLDRVVRFIEANESFIKMLTERESYRSALRKAVIEKTLAGLVWAAIVGMVSLLWTGLKSEAVDLSNYFKGLGK